MQKAYKNRHLRPSKSGDEVLRQLDADEALVFRLVGSDVRATPRMTRLEAWQHWMHEHPGDFARLLSEHHEREAQREHDARKRLLAMEACEAEELAYALSVALEAPEWPEEANPHDEPCEPLCALLDAVALPFDASALPLPVDAWAEVRDDEREGALGALLDAVALPFDASALPLPVDAWAEVRDGELRVAPMRARWTPQRDPRRYRARTALPAQAFMCDTRTHYGR